MDQCLAVETQRAPLPANRFETRGVSDVVVNTVDDRKLMGAGGEYGNVEARKQRLAAGGVFGPQLFDEVVGAHDQTGQASACFGDGVGVENGARGFDHEPK